jgi:hypothetical protein
VACCPAGHELASEGRRRPCPRCRREAVAGLVAAAETSLPRPVIEAAVAAVAPSGQALSQLAAALAADPGALARGAPPVAGRLAAELITRGSKTLAPLLPDTENSDVGGVHDADGEPGISGGVVGEVPGYVGTVPD